MTTPTPEQFLAQPTDPEDDVETEHFDAGNPLESIARSMEALVSLVQRLDTQASDVDALREDLAGLQKSHQVLVEQKEAAWALIDQVIEICMPSTSKLANKIRDVLETPAATPVEEPDPDPDTAGLIQPHPDAPVEEWREYARGGGFQVLDTMNRSQIRTMLGIDQPVAEGAQS